MSDTPRTDKEAFDGTTGEPDLYGVVMADFARELERENTVLCEKWRMAEDQCFDQVGKIGDLERENAALRADKERLDWIIGEAHYLFFKELASDLAKGRQQIDAARKEAQP